MTNHNKTGGAPVGRPPGKKTRATEEQRLRMLQAASQQRVVAPTEQRDRLREAKKLLADAVSLHGVKYLVEVIEMGPFQSVQVESASGVPIVIPMHAEQSRLWQYAMNFAADRCGLPRITEMDIATTEGVPAIEVRLPRFERPSDT